MQAVEFPDCCGLIIINKFKGGHPGSDVDDCATPEQANQYLEQQEKANFKSRAGLVAVLSQPQQDRLGHVFEKRLWKLILKGVDNPRTNNKIYMYFRELTFTEKREKFIFGRH